MKHLVDLIINHGSISFNPFTLNLQQQRFMFPLSDVESKEYDSVDLNTYIEQLIRTCTTTDILSFLQIDEEFKDNLYINITALESTVDFTYEIAFDTMSEAVDFALNKSFDFCYDNNTQDYLPV